MTDQSNRRKLVVTACDRNGSRLSQTTIIRTSRGQSGAQSLCMADRAILFSRLRRRFQDCQIYFDWSAPKASDDDTPPLAPEPRKARLALAPAPAPVLYDLARCRAIQAETVPTIRNRMDHDRDVTVIARIDYVGRLIRTEPCRAFRLIYMRELASAGMTLMEKCHAFADQW